MMKLYRSLLFRELKISRRHYVTRGLLMISFAALLMLAVFVAWKEDITKASPSDLEELRHVVAMFGMMFAMLTAVLACYDADVLQSDVNCGWKRYSYALPITAKDKMLAHYSIKGAAILIGGILCIVFAAVIEKPLGQQLVAGAVNVYFMVLNLLLLKELFCSALIAAGLAEKQTKLLSLLFDVVWICVFAIWIYISYIGEILSNISDMMENGENLSMKFAADVLYTAEGLSVIPFIALSILAVCSFFVSAKAQERREP